MQFDKRQLGGLSPVLGIISQILPQGGLPSVSNVAGGTEVVSSGVAPAAPVASSATSASIGVSGDASCMRAIQKIDDAIVLSSALSRNSGGQTTTTNILIVLAVLQASLGEVCNVAGTGGVGSISGTAPSSSSFGGIGKRDTASEHGAAGGGLGSGLIGSGQNSNGLLGNLLGGGRDDDDDDEDWDDNRGCAEADDSECADLYSGESYGESNISSQTGVSMEYLQPRDAAVTTLTDCTACEAALYSIVKQLQIVFKTNGTVPVNIPGQPRLNAAAEVLQLEATDDMH